MSDLLDDCEGEIVETAQVSFGLGSKHREDWLGTVRRHQEREVRRGVKPH